MMREVPCPGLGAALLRCAAEPGPTHMAGPRISCASCRKSDMLRSILFDDITEQRYQGLVFSTLRSLLRARLIAKMPWNYVDATNLSAHERRQWIKMAKSFGYEVQAVFFDVPLEVCLERNSKRDRSVSEDIMRKMAEKLKPPVFEEGFDKITVVRVKSAG